MKLRFLGFLNLPVHHQPEKSQLFLQLYVQTNNMVQQIFNTFTQKKNLPLNKSKSLILAILGLFSVKRLIFFKRGLNKNVFPTFF